jgi:tetratricopeptide (TPR) repeat protein
MLRRSGSRSRLGPNLILCALLVCVVGLDLHACAFRPTRVEPVPAAASAALAEARAHVRERGEGWREDALAAARSASALSPGWVAPERLVDDLAREELLAVQQLTRRLEDLRDAPDDLPAGDRAGRAYLVGRLEAMAGTARFDEALRLDPDHAWAHHGRGWMLFLSGKPRAALTSGRRAIELARDDWERATFAGAVSRYLVDLGRPEDGARLLGELPGGGRLADHDRAALGVALLRCQVASEDQALVEGGFWHGIDLLREHDLVDEEVREIAASLLAVARRSGFPGTLAELEAAIAARPGPARDVARASLLYEHGAMGLARELFERANGETRPSPARFDRVSAPATIEAWRAGLPAQVLDSAGEPRRAELAALVRAARAAERAGGAADLALGQALLDAGWFLEARALAASLGGEDLDAALRLDERALAGDALLSGIRGLLDLVDREAPYRGPRDLVIVIDDDSPREITGEIPPADAPIRSLDTLLGAMQPLFERHLEDPGHLASTPRLEYGPAAVVLHPGPRFSPADEAAGRGTAGEPVGGLAAELAALGRFGLFGETLGGGGPDGTVLRLLATETRSGEHLGVAYSGTVAWCEGVDVPSRPVRQGARITGAALHEGYWIDVGGVRDELARWRDLEQRFLARGERPAALDASTPELRVAPGSAEGILSAERRRPYAPLGQGDRVRLAVLVDRAGRPAGERVTLEELLEVTARHEEGHLTDRTRFLPIAEKPLRALRLLASAGFSPRRLMRRLEYRAQLVALCVLEDPRLALAECLDGLEGGANVTPHASAYAELVDDFLEALDGSLEEFPALDGERYLVHQLHRLAPEEVRRVALRLAEDAGLVED